MKAKITISVLAILILTSLQFTVASAQENEEYRIELSVTGFKKKKVIMGKYYGNKNYLVDSGRLDSNGRVSFRGPKLIEGLYFFSFGKDMVFDFIADDDQIFKALIDLNEPQLNSSFKGSAQNSRFYKYIRANKLDIKLIDSLNAQLSLATRKDSAALKEEIESLRRNIKNRSSDMVRKRPRDLIGRIVLLNTDPEVPDSVKRKDGNSSRKEQFLYFKKHYWDNTNFTDPRLLNTPYYYTRLHRYFEDLTLKQSSETIKSVDFIMNRASRHPNFFTYTFDYISERFHTPKTMGDDAVFVHLVEKHLNSKTESWVDSTNVFRFRSRAADMKLSIIGEVAQELNLPDLNGKKRKLSRVKADATVLVFYNSGCGNCKVKIPKYRTVLDTCTLENFKVYAVCTEGSKASWKKFVEDNSLESWINVYAGEEHQNFRQKFDVYSVPLIFVLDENKKIRAKQLQPEQLDFFLRERMQ